LLYGSRSAILLGPPDSCDDITGIDVAIFEKGFIKALYVFIDGGPSASLARGWPLCRVIWI
jgi:hypothetical protein